MGEFDSTQYLGGILTTIMIGHAQKLAKRNFRPFLNPRPNLSKAHSLSRQKRIQGRRLSDAIRPLEEGGEHRLKTKVTRLKEILKKRSYAWALRVAKEQLERKFKLDHPQSSLTVSKVLKSFGLSSGHFRHLILFGPQGYKFDETVLQALRNFVKGLTGQEMKLEDFVLDLVEEEYAMPRPIYSRIHQDFQNYCITAYWLIDFAERWLADRKARTPDLAGKIPHFKTQQLDILKAEINAFDILLVSKLIIKLLADWETNLPIYPAFQ